MQRLSALIFILIFSSALEAMVILKVKEDKALIDLEGEKVTPGDHFDAINLYGKSLGVLQIKKIKRGKAIGVLVKGKMGVSWILEPTPTDSLTKAPGAGNEEAYNSPRESFNPPPRNRSNPDSGIGLVAGLNYNMVFVDGRTAAGTGQQGAIIVDFPLKGSLSSRLFLGYQSLFAQGKGCLKGRCRLFIHYPGIGGLVRGKFLRNSNTPAWMGVGGFLLWPFVSKQATLGLNESSFSGFHGSITGAIGVDIQFDGFYIPIQMDASWINPLIFSPGSGKHIKPIYIGIKLGFALPM